MKRAALFLAAALFTSVATEAATIHVTPKVADVLNADFTPADPSLIVANDGTHLLLNPSTSKLILQVDVSMTIEGGTFGNVAFNINLDNLRQSGDAPGWMPDFATFDTNGPLPGGIRPKWADNGDYGPNGSDLQAIIVGVAPKDFGNPIFDPRPQLGQNGPEFMGSVYLEWDSPPGTVGRLDLVVVGASQVIESNLTVDGVEAFGGSVLINTPEPSSLTLLCLGAMAIAAIRRPLAGWTCSRCQ